MVLTVATIYKLELTGEEFHLISKALRNVLKDEELETARLLQKEMMERKISLARHHMNEMEKLEKNLKGS